MHGFPRKTPEIKIENRTTSERKRNSGGFEYSGHNLKTHRGDPSFTTWWTSTRRWVEFGVWALQRMLRTSTVNSTSYRPDVIWRVSLSTFQGTGGHTHVYINQTCPYAIFFQIAKPRKTWKWTVQRDMMKRPFRSVRDANQQGPLSKHIFHHKTCLLKGLYERLEIVEKLGNWTHDRLIYTLDTSRIFIFQHGTKTRRHCAINFLRNPFSIQFNARCRSHITANTLSPTKEQWRCCVS